MERLSDKEISDTILGHLEKLVRKLNNEPTFILPELKRIIVTRWGLDPFFQGVYSYRNHESDLVSYCLFSLTGNFVDIPVIVYPMRKDCITPICNVSHRFRCLSTHSILGIDNNDPSHKGFTYHTKVWYYLMHTDFLHVLSRI